MADAGLREAGSDLKLFCFSVGASLLAKVVDGEAFMLDERVALTFFASKLAPTGFIPTELNHKSYRPKLTGLIALTEAERNLSGKSSKHSAASQ
ncbi:MAG: hypothetical protein JWP42_3970 [Pseudomonas sp.]|nr:hypothetical protein [Pseudomonas sp.]